MEGGTKIPKATQLESDWNAGLIPESKLFIFKLRLCPRVCVCVCVCVRVHPRVCVMRDTCGMCLLCPGAHGSTAIYFSSFHPSLSRNCLLSHLPPHSFCPGCCSGSERTTHHHCHLYCNWDEPALALALAWLRGPLGNRVGN